MKRSHTGLGLALAAGLVLGVAPAAFAAGTDAGTQIDNQASVDFTVGGVNQPDVDSNTTSFVVDRQISLTVAEVGGANTTVVPGDTDQVLTFTVTNDSNSTLDFKLTLAQDGSDDFNATTPVIRVENGLAAGYQSSGPNADTATFIDELAADDTVTVYIVGDIPSSRVDGDLANITLTATAAQSVNVVTGAYVATVGSLAADAAESNTGTADDPAFTDTVFADNAGDTDIAEDGKHSDTDTYEVVTATIVVTKSSIVVEDPFTGVYDGLTIFPKAIPGATIEYCLDVENTGSATAGSIVLTDAIPANTTFVSASITSNATGTGTACDVGTGTAEDDNTTDNTGDEADPDGGSYDSGTGEVTITSPSITAGSRWKATFRVTVD